MIPPNSNYLGTASDTTTDTDTNTQCHMPRNYQEALPMATNSDQGALQAAAGACCDQLHIAARHNPTLNANALHPELPAADFPHGKAAGRKAALVLCICLPPHGGALAIRCSSLECALIDFRT
jgi:hypothetical protein